MDNKNVSKNDMDSKLSSIIKPEDLDKLNAEAEEVVEKMNTNENENIEEIMEQLGNLGGKEQSSAGDSLSSLRRPVKEMMDNKDNHEVPENLLKLRNYVNELDPSSLKENGLKGFFSKILKKSPVDKYVQKYQSVEQNIEVIVKGLLRGQDRLQEDNADLEIIKKDSQEKIYSLEKQIYLGKQLFEVLEKRKEDQEWTEKNKIITEAQEKVIVRTKNMATMVNVLQQSLASVDIIKKNNDKLKEAIRNSIDTTKNIAPVTAAIHMALTNQTKLIDAINNVNEATENMIMGNARMLKENTEETTKLLENPSISIEKLQEAYNDIYSAIEAQEQSSRRIVSNSKEFVDKLDELNSDMRNKISD